MEDMQKYTEKLEQYYNSENKLTQYPSKSLK